MYAAPILIGDRLCARFRLAFFIASWASSSERACGAVDAASLASAEIRSAGSRCLPFSAVALHTMDSILCEFSTPLCRMRSLKNCPGEQTSEMDGPV